jgi:CheY-like chemotaxis protein
VKIYLPRHYGPAEEAPGPGQAAPALPAGMAGEIVLVVEDEDGVRRLSVDLLRELGYTVRHAAGAEAALRLLAEQPDIRLLFTDVVMPAINGRELADRARALRPGLRVLFTTGYTRNAVVHNGLLDPGVQLLTKPFTLEQLARAVRDALDRVEEASL